MENNGYLLYDVICNVKLIVLVGVFGVFGLFSEEIIKEMY